MKIKKKNRCPLTYQVLTKGQKYSRVGLKQLSSRLMDFNDIPLTAEAQRIEARKRAHKMSIQGVQSKLSAKLNVAKSCFEMTDIHGKFILKPQSNVYYQLPENEDVSMRMASCVGIQVPLHGLVYSQDQSLTFFIKRFDRQGRKQKLAVEDFAQLSNNTRETKYNFSMEGVAAIIEKFCTFHSVTCLAFSQSTR